MTNPNQIAVIGDRLFTDVMMANMMGAWSIWVKDGVVKNDGFVSLKLSIDLRLLRRFAVFALGERVARQIEKKWCSASSSY